MQKRCLGSTGIQVSPIGLGTVKFGRNQGVKYPAAFQLPKDQDIKNILAIAKANGVNLLDTAPAYGVSEERLGQCLSGQRDDWVICTKVGESFTNGISSFDFSAQGIIKSVERSLKRLKTDNLDIVLVHSNGEDVEIIENEQVFATLVHLKEVGKIRSFGMSTKTITGGIKTIEMADVIMMTYHPDYQEEAVLLKHAAHFAKGVFIKKAFASGHRPNIETNLRFIFKEPAVSSVVIGTINPVHLLENLQCAATLLR